MLANPPMANGDHGTAPMMDKNNIINVRDGESLFQICLKLRKRLSDVPGFRPYLEEMEEQEADGLTDPVSSLWRCFRSGLPLLAIYNASQPEEGDLQVDKNKPESKIGKEAAFLFIRACMERMSIPASDTFTITDLYSDNTTGFVKVTKLINRVLDLLNMSGKLHLSNEDLREEQNDVHGTGVPEKMTRRQYILRELVESERHYVHHLLNLQALKKELEELGALTGDSIHDIFLNLNNLLDFAQRFLIRIEQHFELTEEQQNWGDLFVHYKEPFKQYEPFIANQRRCEETCQKEWDKMVKSAKSTLMHQMLANPTILNGFLLKPFQRMTKYPLLLKDLQNQTQHPRLKMDLANAISIIQEVLHLADASIDKETREDALKDLKDRVDDWKGLTLSDFGELLLFGTFNVLKDGGIRDQEKEYHIFLFARILIMCKEANMNKNKNKIMGGKDKPSLSLRGKPRMHLKGRIYLANVTDNVTTSGPGNYVIQIVWKGDPATESFIIKFKNDDTMKRWSDKIEDQRAQCTSMARQNGTSTTNFVGLQHQQIENPYLQQQDQEEEDFSRMSGTTYGGGDYNYSEFSMSRNASSTSLRQRSATGGSGSSGSTAHPTMGRGHRFPSEIGNLPILNTKMVAHSPGEYAGNSYFSPVDRETPESASVSARSSSQSAFAGFHRGAGPSNGMVYPEESYRNTAPAMARNISGTTSNGNPYLPNSRGMRPSLPAGTVQSAQETATRNRMRSASSPDINPLQQQHARKYTSTDSAPSVPPIPAHVKNMAPPNRSHSNSPSSSGPMRNGHSSQQHHGMPLGSRAPQQSSQYIYDPAYGPPADRKLAQGMSALSIAPADRQLSPPLSTPSSSTDSHGNRNSFMPSQLRAKVRFDENYVSMIIPSNIQFRSLTDRIDAKLARFTNANIASGTVRLRYQDEDGDFIWIDSDDAVHEALLDWRETNRGETGGGGGPYAEILLFAHSIEK